MKRLALAAVIFTVAACSKADDAATMDTTPAMAPAPAPVTTDTAMMDTTKTDTTKTTTTP